MKVLWTWTYQVTSLFVTHSQEAQRERFLHGAVVHQTDRPHRNRQRDSHMLPCTAKGWTLAGPGSGHTLVLKMVQDGVHVELVPAVFVKHGGEIILHQQQSPTAPHVLSLGHSAIRKHVRRE